jgi:hypothetical protein
MNAVFALPLCSFSTVLKIFILPEVALSGSCVQNEILGTSFEWR